MNKKYLNIAILLLAPLVLTGCNIKNPLSMFKNKVEEVKTTVEEKVTENTGINSMLGMNKNTHCTMQDELSKTDIYVGNGKTRTTMSMTTEELTLVNHAIIDGEWMYSWQEGSDQGTKMNWKLLEEQTKELQKEFTDMAEDYTEETEDDDTYLGNLDLTLDYKCTDWKVDNAMFELPKDVTFIDQMEAIQDISNSMKEGADSEDMCGFCDSITEGEAKVACLESFGCN